MLLRESGSDSGDRALLTEALDQFYHCEPDVRTLELLAAEEPDEKDRGSH